MENRPLDVVKQTRKPLLEGRMKGLGRAVRTIWCAVRVCSKTGGRCRHSWRSQCEAVTADLPPSSLVVQDKGGSVVPETSKQECKSHCPRISRSIDPMIFRGVSKTPLWIVSHTSTMAMFLLFLLFSSCPESPGCHTDTAGAHCTRHSQRICSPLESEVGSL